MPARDSQGPLALPFAAPPSTPRIQRSAVLIGAEIIRFMEFGVRFPKVAAKLGIGLAIVYRVLDEQQIGDPMAASPADQRTDAQTAHLLGAPHGEHALCRCAVVGCISFVPTAASP
jgi:hypothetical protein